VTDDDIRVFLTVREDPEPLYFWASDLAYCGHTKPSIRLLRESIRRNFYASAIETDPMFATIRDSAEYRELLATPGMPSPIPRACQPGACWRWEVETRSWCSRPRLGAPESQAEKSRTFVRPLTECRDREGRSRESSRRTSDN
jgi:hypothetical protein